jgi:hypothetical protein
MLRQASKLERHYNLRNQKKYCLMPRQHIRVTYFSQCTHSRVRFGLLQCCLGVPIMHFNIPRKYHHPAHYFHGSINSSKSSVVKDDGARSSLVNLTQASRGFEGNSCFFIFVKLLQDNGFMKCCPCEFGFVDFWSLSLSLGCLVHKVTLCRSIIIRIKLCLGTYIASSCRPSRA